MAAYARRRSRQISAPTPAGLARAAERYMARFAASEASLRRILNERIKRAVRANPDFAADIAARTNLQAAIEDIIGRYKNSGILDDAVYASGRVASLRRAGRSRMAIKKHLYAKGIAADLAEQSLTGGDPESGEDQELRAARRLAQRKKLGPYRLTAGDPARQRKDIALLARAGFSYAVIRKVLGAGADVADLLADHMDHQGLDIP